MPKQKRNPTRTCMVCRTQGDKRTLTRIVKVSEKQVQIDPTGKQPGRGAYVCNRAECWEGLRRPNLLNKALRVSVTDEQIARLNRQRTSISQE